MGSGGGSPGAGLGKDSGQRKVCVGDGGAGPRVAGLLFKEQDGGGKGEQGSRPR